MLLDFIFCLLASLIIVSVVSECHTTNNSIVSSQTTSECLSLLVDRYNGSDVNVLILYSCLFLYSRSYKEDPLSFYSNLFLLYVIHVLVSSFFLICVKM